MIFRAVIVNVGFVSHARKSSTSAPGWFKQRRPLIGMKPRRHQTAIRDQANVCSHTATASSQNLSFEGYSESASQKPLRATCRPSKTASSIPEGQPASCREHSPRNRDRNELIIGIGNASAQFNTGSARGQPRLAPSHAKSSVTGTAANPRVRGRAIGTRESLRDHVPDRDSPVVFAPLRLSSASSSPCRAEVGSTAVHDRHLPG
jgi:hypothetical protein